MLPPWTWTDVSGPVSNGAKEQKCLNSCDLYVARAQRTLLVTLPMIQVYCPYVPSEKLLMATLVGDSDRNLSVTFGSPSLIIRCTIISPLKTIVHVESRNRCVRVRKTSATPASPAWVATRRCSTYFDLGAASC